MPRFWRRAPPIHLRTDRFDIITMTKLEAARRTFAYAGDLEVIGPAYGATTPFTFKKWYKQLRKYNNRKKFCFGIRPKGTDHVIGFELVEITSFDCAFLAVVIGDRDWWGKGVVRECRGAILDYLFTELNCRRAWGTPSVRNFPSIFNYHALGFTKEGVMRERAIDWQTREPVDYAIFGILKREWIKNRGQQTAELVNR